MRTDASLLLFPQQQSTVSTSKALTLYEAESDLPVISSTQEDKCIGCMQILGYFA